MNERLKFMGRLTEKKLKALEIKLRIEGLRDAIRDALDPFEEIEDLKARVVAGQAVDLSELHLSYSELMEDIRKLKKELGEK